MMSKNILNLLIGSSLVLVNSCTQEIRKEPVFPLSDPDNTGNWILAEDLSDEFEASTLDTSKWFVQGTDSVYRSNWIGRAPSQFSPGNVRMEDGKLKIQTRWDTDFKFAEKLDYSYPEVEGEGRAYENITTAAVICKNPVHYSYMEIKCKAGDASVTSSFWALGNRQELDIFEFIGRPSKPDKEHIETRFMSNMIDWTKPREDKRQWRGKVQLDWRVADDFHVYGCEWDPDYLKFYADGKLINEVTRAELGEKWCLTKPMWIWFDSETFPWDGIPTEEDLPEDYEIEYIRVWKKSKLPE
jgi:beta-glucanase (GH16 family)